jgi:MFS family permease
LLSASFFYWLAFELIQPTLPLYVLEIGATRLELGLILSISSIALISTRIPFGLISGRLGRWNLMMFSLAVNSISGFLYLLSVSPEWLYPVRTLHGVGMATYSPMAMSVSLDLGGKLRRGKTVGLYMTVMSACSMIGPVINSLLIERGGFFLVFLAAAFFPLMGFLLCLFGRVTHSIEEKSRSTSEKKSLFQDTSNVLSSLRNLLISRPMIAVSISRISYSITYAILLALFSVYIVQNLFILPFMVGLFFAFRGLAETFSRWPSGMLCDRIGMKKPTLFAYVSTALAFIILSKGSAVELIVSVMLIIGAGHAIRNVGEVFLLGDLCERGETAVAMSYMSTIYDIGRVIGAILAGFFAAYLPLPWIFQLSALILLIGITPLALVKVR